MRQNVGRRGSPSRVARSAKYRLARLRRKLRSRLQRALVESGRSVIVNVNGVDLRAPHGHPYARGGYAAAQPLRNRPLEVITSVLAAASTDVYSAVDVGANIGDTAAMMRSNGVALILIEPDPLYAQLLRSNLAQLHNVRRVEEVLISSEPVAGVLARSDGTARVSQSDEVVWLPWKPLAEVCDSDTKLVKLDTDGYDLKIIADSVDFLSQQRPLLYFELEATSHEALEAAADTISTLSTAGYQRFIAWDDAGLMLVSDCEGATLVELLEYVCHGTRRAGHRTTICGLDILGCNESDIELLREIADQYRRLQWTSSRLH
jgi:FkbM family methyltransferase